MRKLLTYQLIICAIAFMIVTIGVIIAGFSWRQNLGLFFILLGCAVGNIPATVFWKDEYDTSV